MNEKKRFNYWKKRFHDDDIPWDTNLASDSIIKLEKNMELIPGSSLLVLGSRAGREAIYLSRLGYMVSLIDSSINNSTNIRNKVRNKKLSMEILTCDLFNNIPEKWNFSFDVILEHRFLSGVDPQKHEDYLKKVKSLLKPRGRFFGTFLINEDASNSEPIFYFTKGEIEELFKKDFDFIKFEESTNENDMEWCFDFKKK